MGTSLGQAEKRRCANENRIAGAPNEGSANSAEVARTAEMLGFESLWAPDHSVMPVHTATPLPETRPGEGGIPEIY